MTTHIYGIANCGTVKKALSWLKDNQISYQFHDFKKEKPTLQLLKGWAAQLGWQTLLNRQGTTWRNLDDATKLQAQEAETAFAVMVEKSSVIKRPIVAYNGSLLVGYNEVQYSALFSLDPLPGLAQIKLTQTGLDTKFPKPKNPFVKWIS